MASHDIAHPGFQSARRGELVRLGVSPEDRSAEIVLRDLTILGVPLAEFTLERPRGDTRLLRLNFDRAMTEADAFGFLQTFADAWSATLADGKRDPWYGNLYVDIRWARVKRLTAQSGGIEASMQMISVDGVAVAPARLTDLRWSPLTDVFVEGMKASQPKSKFLFWFVILEELEKRQEFLSLFTPMFSPEEKGQLQEVVRSNGGALQRLNGLLNSPATTLEGRAAKLARIVDAVGSSGINGLSGPIVVDQARCAALIEQRNKIAHKGSSINKDLLYNVLFPLSRTALNYILDRDAESASEAQPLARDRTRSMQRAARPQPAPEVRRLALDRQSSESSKPPKLHDDQRAPRAALVVNHHAALTTHHRRCVHPGAHQCLVLSEGEGGPGYATMTTMRVPVYTGWHRGGGARVTVD